MNKHLYRHLAPLGCRVLFEKLDPKTSKSIYASSISRTEPVIRCVVYFSSKIVYDGTTYTRLMEVLPTICGPFVVRYLPGRIEIHYIE